MTLFNRMEEVKDFLSKLSVFMLNNPDKVEVYSILRVMCFEHMINEQRVNELMDRVECLETKVILLEEDAR